MKSGPQAPRLYRRLPLPLPVTAVILSLTAAATLAPVATACTDLARAPSSRWQVTVEDDVAWLITPCGDRFFSLGVNVVDGGAEGERPSYASLRHYPDPIAFWTATRARLIAWGFNTLGAGSVPAQVLKLPVTPDLGLGRASGFHWIDPFHPAMGDAMKAWAEYLAGPYRGSPLRIGYFSDNEVGWWNGTLYTYFIQKPPGNHTKRRLVTLLREHYGGDWRRFSADFVADGLGSFDELLDSEGRLPRLRPGGHGIQAVRRWTGLVADHYYRLVHDALRAVDPDALILGDRLPIYYDPVAVKAMARYVDIVSVNYDVDSPDGWIARYFFEGIRRLASKPVLISEWFFSARENRSGNRNTTGLMTVATQEDRARGAAAAAQNFARHPAIVGLHWYMFYDEPAGGRRDGGDHNFGLIDIRNEPYREVVSALARVNSQLVALQRMAAPPATVMTARLPYARIDPTDRTLTDWPKPESLLLPMTASPGEVVFGDVYVTWSERGLAFALIGMDYYDPGLLAYDGDFPRTEAFRLRIGVDVGAGPRRFVLNLIPRERNAGDPYDHTPELCGGEGNGCPPVEGVEARSFWFNQPRITAKLLIPWKALGVKSVPRRPELRLEVAVTAFFRSRWISFSGLAPEVGLSRPDRWPRLRLSTAVSSSLQHLRTRVGGVMGLTSSAP
jgi:hypothetical protein